MPPGSLSLTVLTSSATRARTAASASHFLERRGEIDFGERVVARRPLRLRRVYAQTFEPDIVGAALRRRLHFVAQAIPIGDEPRMQRRRAGQDDAHGKKPPFRRLGMRAHFRLDRAKKAGLVARAARVDEDLRPARGVRHDAPHLCNSPVGDFDDAPRPFRRIP